MRDTQEKWKPIEETGGKYSVSNMGRVRNNNTENILTPSTKDGYLKINLHMGSKRMTRYVHRLVAIAFIPNPENKPQVNHINGIHGDARAENLEWVTGEENMRHAAENHLWEKGMAKIGTSEHIPRKDRDRKSLLKKTDKITENQLKEIVESAEKNDVTVYRYVKNLEDKVNALQKELTDTKNNEFLVKCLKTEIKQLNKENSRLESAVPVSYIGVDNPEYSVGNKRNNLTIVGYGKDNQNKTMLLCRCDCGNIKLENPTLWKRGVVKSCGCMHDELCRIAALRKEA